MAKLNISYTQCADSEEAYRRVVENLSRVLAEWNIKADITCRDESRNIQAVGKGFSMDIHFGDKEAVADLTLSFPLSALKQTIVTPLERELKKYL